MCGTFCHFFELRKTKKTIISFFLCVKKYTTTQYSNGMFSCFCAIWESHNMEINGMRGKKICFKTKNAADEPQQFVPKKPIIYVILGLIGK